MDIPCKRKRPSDARQRRRMMEMVAAATFLIGPKGRRGQCVLIEGGLIITASHCLHFSSKGDMTCEDLFMLLALGDYFLNAVCGDKGKLLVETLSFDPVSDVAVLGSPDNQSLPEDADAFDEFCERVQPVKLLRHIPKPRAEFRVWIRTHTNTWVAGQATYSCGRGFAYDTKIEIPYGTSGGPIVNDNGELVGVVSHGVTTRYKGLYKSAAPLLPLALPVWILNYGAT